MAQVFTPLPRVPDHPALEREVLAWWEERAERSSACASRTAATALELHRRPDDRQQTTMGVHHLWGRTYKDVFQRYKALRGFDQRYQNGFDCQGLWVEVEVERDLGLNSKREIEDYGLDEFARRCRELVAESA